MKHGLEQFSRTFMCAVFCLASIVATAAPMVSSLKVTPVEPLGLAIDFNVSGATADSADLLINVAMTAGDATYVAKNLVGAMNCVDGAHRVYWNMAKDGIAIDPATASLTVTYEYPLYCVIDLSGGSETNSYPVAYMNAPPNGGFSTIEYKTTKLVLKRVDAGSFKMQNSTTVMLTKPFYMGLYEVTQRQWELVTGSNPCSSTSYGKGDAYPVHYVSYDMIRGSVNGAMWPESNAVDESSFLGKLRTKTGNLPFDLPTEAQWEYACRAGTTTTYSYGDSADGAYMWYSSNSSSTHEVGTKLPNKWGFCDMHGNVWEWCLDWYGTLSYGTDPAGSSSGSRRMTRGGSWNSAAGHCALSYRNRSHPSYSDYNLGFRLSRTIPFLAETGTASATVEFALGRICADGSSIDGMVSLGYAPTEGRNAVVTINGEVLLNASGVGNWTWYAPEAGTYAFSHAVGDDVMSAAYVVANGYAKAEGTPMISDLKVTPIEPLGLAIDFNVSGASDADLDNAPPLAVSVSVNGTNYLAKTLVGATNCVNGAHRIYWNMAKDGIALDPATASLTVAYCNLYCVVDLSGGSSAKSYPVAYLSAPPSGGFSTTEYKTTKLVLKRVDAGSFIMGDDQADESHRVTLTKPFYMGLYEVTQRQWELVLGSNPCSSTSYGKGDAYPVHYISYDMIRGSVDGAMWPESNAVDSSSFLGKLRDRTKLDFDLPMEAQWEYACRAGTTTTYSYGDSVDGAYMWCSLNSSSSTHEVGTKLPNKWGLYDMHGNLWEWCLDWCGSLPYGTDPKGSSSDSRRVLRGGNWNDNADICTSSYRLGLRSWCNNGKSLGFRLSRTIPFLAGTVAASATVEFALGRICADGSSIDGKMPLGYAPTESRNAVVAINGEVLLNASGAGSWTWYAPEAGTYEVSHAVGEDVMSAAYAVTNGYAKAEEMPNPPMEAVEGIALSPSDEIAVSAKGKKQIIKISGNGEAWTGATSAEWLKLNSESGTATKSIVCTIEENVDAEGRVGYVYIAGQTLKVTQTGRGATVNAQVAVDTAGGEVAVGVSVTDETTTWSASSECPWIQVENQSGTGSGDARLRVLPWNKAMSRTGTVTIAGQTVTVTQEAATLAVSATSVTVVAQGKTLSVDVETGSAVEWAIADIPEWITLDGDTARRGMDSVVLVVSPNTTFEDRTATIKIAGKEFVATQDAAKVTLEGGAMRCCNTSGFDTLIVTVRVDVATAPWTVAISEDAADWVFLMSDEAPAVGDGTFELYVPPEEGDSLPRTATVTVGNATLRITQDDGVVIKGGNVPFIIPTSWFAKYPTLGGTTVDEWQKIAEGAGVKTDASGAAQPVWHDYVAGTDPTDAASRFTASVALEDGKPVVTWSPALNGEGVREGERTYRVWGKADLGDAAWSEVAPGGEAGYRFFRVTVEMP